MKKNNTIVFLGIFFLLLLPALSFCQASVSKNDTAVVSTMEAIQQLHLTYGKGKIVLKDKSIIVKVIIHDIKPYWIVYSKEGSLHDLMIEQVDRIKFQKKGFGRDIVFDKNNKPKII